MGRSARELSIVHASAKLLIDRFHPDLTFEKAKNLVERNRATRKPMLYAGANYDLGDFLATGCQTGVFVDPQYENRYNPKTPNWKTYREDFVHSLRGLDLGIGASDFSICELGIWPPKWLVAFTFCGEKKTVVCYGLEIRILAKSLKFRSEEPWFPKDRSPFPELENGISHYTTVHYPTEWGSSFVNEAILNLVVPGGHVETWYPEDITGRLKSLGFESFHQDDSVAIFESRCCKSSQDGVSIYDRLRAYAIFRLNDIERDPC